MTSSTSARRKCEPGCTCGRHRRKVDAVETVAAPLLNATTADVSVLVPARLNTERARLWEFLRPKWEDLGYEVLEGSCEGEWCKAAAVADALSRATADVLVVADADVWSDGVPQAVAAVRRGAGWAIPHYRVLRLSKPATADVLSTGQWPRRRTSITYAQRPYPGRPGGGIVVLERKTYEKVPLDRRFVGWGQEDESWALALRLLAGPSWRGVEDLYHLWHDPAPRQSRVFGSAASMRLHNRYAGARKNPARMRQILAEAS